MLVLNAVFDAAKYCALRVVQSLIAKPLKRSRHSTRIVFTSGEVFWFWWLIHLASLVETPVRRGNAILKCGKNYRILCGNSTVQEGASSICSFGRIEEILMKQCPMV